ncbi:TrmH family RNA methyltransferase [Methylobrevis albus]|uniref:RNA methyltransferase n=1 Tax=Methylobrevis albus TaxID=2793297 RepID=A0A931I5D3_9HYPH|nr:RNA methyltransferase [Methylobrevis albus]MBH0239749.1 RNA methyltransferase [Methylobrevis albus]
MPLVHVTDPADPRVAPYLDIRDRDLAGHGGFFVAEGEVVVRQLVTASRFRPHSLLLAEKRVAALTDVIAALPASVPVFVAAQAVMDRIVGFPIHRGILGLGLRGAAPLAADLIAAAPPVIVCAAGIANHDNIGGIFRNAAAFGAGAVLIDGASCDPLYRKAIRVSVGAALRVPFARVESVAAMLDLLEAADYRVVGLSPAGSLPLARLVPPPRVALLLGSEGPGLPADVLARTMAVRIDMSGGFDSLNVATTSGIALYHLTRAGV